MSLKIYFRKINQHEHELRIQRVDGTEEHQMCETRSFLVHDLTHFAFEAEAHLQNGFWGQVAAGRSLAELSDRESIRKLDPNSEMMRIEKVVAIFQGMAKGTAPESIIEIYNAQKSNFDWAKPEWFDFEFIARVGHRLQGLVGHWNATGFGESMTIEWILPNP